MERTVGFTCACCGDERTWAVSITALARMDPCVRALYFGLMTRDRTRETRDWKLASRKAEALLRKHISAAQRRELRTSEAFHVVGADGRTYRIERASCRNVVLVEDGKDVARYCAIVGKHRVPDADLMLIHKLVLENCPEEFFKVANVELYGGGRAA